MSQLYAQLKDGDKFTFVPIEATLNPNGTYSLKVDTEIEVSLDGADLIISNIKMGSVDQTKNTLRYVKVQNDGTIVMTESGLEKYQVADIDEATSTRYYGFVDLLENWYIMRWDTALDEFRFKAGVGSYPVAWTGRADLVYDYFFNTTFV